MDKQLIDDVSEDQLKFGYWVLTHKDKLKQWLKIFLICLGSIFWLITIYNLVIYIVQLPQDAQIMQGIAYQAIDFKSFATKNKPLPLQISEPQLIYTGNNHYDFVAPIINPNLNRGVVKLVYQFTAGSYTTPTATVVILPSEHNYLLSLGNVSQTRLNNVSLKIITTTWESVLHKMNYPQPVVEITDLAGFADDKLSRFAVDFQAKNLSVDNFWDADFNIVLFSDDRIVGANRITLAQFLSGETRAAEVNWYDPLPRISKVEAVPMIDVYDLDNRFQVSGETPMQ